MKEDRKHTISVFCLKDYILCASKSSKGVIDNKYFYFGERAVFKLTSSFYCRKNFTNILLVQCCRKESTLVSYKVLGAGTVFIMCLQSVQLYTIMVFDCSLCFLPCLLSTISSLASARLIIKRFSLRAGHLNNIP